MKKTTFTAILLTLFLTAFKLAPSTGVNYEKTYSFDRCNIFKMEIYAKNNELMQTKEVRTYYQSAGQNFLVKFMPGKGGYGQETIIDKANEIAVQIFNAGSPSAMYNAGGFKYPAPEDLKQLQITPTNETKQILGYTCKKYTYTYKKIFGEVWITDQVKLSDDIGVFRACKMAALHNTLSEKGFVMEMTTEDSGGGRTLMTTTVLEKNESYEVDLSRAEVSKAMNKVNYYVF